MVYGFTRSKNVKHIIEVFFVVFQLSTGLKKMAFGIKFMVSCVKFSGGRGPFESDKNRCLLSPETWHLKQLLEYCPAYCKLKIKVSVTSPIAGDVLK